MDLIVECPVCETALRINRPQGRGSVICPCCQRKFDASQAKRQEAETVAPILRGDSIDRSATAVPNPLTALAQTQGPSSDDDINLKAIKRIGTKRRVRRKKRSQLPALLSLLALTALATLFVGFLYLFQQKQIKTAALQKENEMAAVEKENEMRAQPTPRAQPTLRARTPSRRPIAGGPGSTDQIRMSEPADFSLEMANPDPVPLDPIRRLLEMLAQSGEQCEAFQFLPENELQYEQLQTFALQLSLAKALLADDQEGEVDSKDRDSLTERSVHWLQTMKALVTQVAADAPERLPRINAFAKTAFEKGSSLDKAKSQLVFYGFVFLRGTQTKPNSILKFDRKQIYCSVPGVPKYERSSNESYRVYFVETPETPSQKHMHSPGGGLIKVSSARLFYAFDPTGSED